MALSLNKEPAQQRVSRVTRGSPGRFRGAPAQDWDMWRLCGALDDSRTEGAVKKTEEPVPGSCRGRLHNCAGARRPRAPALQLGSF